MAVPGSKSLRRSLTSLFISLTFLVLAVSGGLAFFRPFSLQIVGLHALMGFVFIGIVLMHVWNNRPQLKGYFRKRVAWLALAVSVSLTFMFFLQPKPIKAVLGLSENLGPAMDRFEMREDGMVYHYSPSPDYKMELKVKSGPSYDPDNPPQIAIWLENQGAFHIKTLRSPDKIDKKNLRYWAFKRRGWEEARKEAESEEKTDAISTPTPNGSFDPADYILPADSETSTPYQLLIEINQQDDAFGPHLDQPSLVYAVEIDNLRPVTFQLLELVGYPKREDEDGKEAWSLYFVDDGFESAVELIDSALLTIERK